MRVSILVALTLWACAQTSWHAPAKGSSTASVYTYPWLWMDEQGQQVALSQWRGTPLVMTAIYTSCDETCPRTIAKLRKVYEDYQRDGRKAEFVLVTLDPRTDTIDHLRDYKQKQKFPAAWHLLRGDLAQTEQLANLLGVHQMPMEPHYVHESRITVFDGTGASNAVLDVF